MTAVWCVRAEYGRYAEAFVQGGYVAIGWMRDDDLSAIDAREELVEPYKCAYPDDTSAIVIGQQVGQISRFLLEIKPGDLVIAPDSNIEHLHIGTVKDEPYRYMPDADDGCPYPHRRIIEWRSKPLLRSSLSVPLQNTMRSSLTVFGVSQTDEILRAIGRGDEVKDEPVAYDPYETVLAQVLELHDSEFEVLVGHLLTALGFEETDVRGKTGDGGVDVTGEFDVDGFAKIKVYVQAKRYKRGKRIGGNVVRALRAAIPINGQGAFITTADFQKNAYDVALEQGFPRIGLIAGHQLVDLLVEHWAEIPKDFRERLGLKPGLVVA